MSDNTKNKQIEQLASEIDNFTEGVLALPYQLAKYLCNNGWERSRYEVVSK